MFRMSPGCVPLALAPFLRVVFLIKNELNLSELLGNLILFPTLSKMFTTYILLVFIIMKMFQNSILTLRVNVYSVVKQRMNNKNLRKNLIHFSSNCFNICDRARDNGPYLQIASGFRAILNLKV